jgi:putative transposase
MSYDPLRHHRHSIRLQGYDYTEPGAYFVTICTHDRVCSLGTVMGGQMQLNDWGRMVAECWVALPVHFVYVTLDEWVVMPNHMHGIVVITDSVVGARQSRAPTVEQIRHPLPGSNPTIIRSFKSVVTKRINLLRGTTAPPVWQRNYYEHIAQDERGLCAIRRYIRQNPAKWNLDRDNAANGLPEASTAGEYVREAQA